MIVTGYSVELSGYYYDIDYVIIAVDHYLHHYCVTFEKYFGWVV